jgi:hypothetical protein
VSTGARGVRGDARADLPTGDPVDEGTAGYPDGGHRAILAGAVRAGGVALPLIVAPLGHASAARRIDPPAAARLAVAGPGHGSRHGPRCVAIPARSDPASAPRLPAWPPIGPVQVGVTGLHGHAAALGGRGWHDLGWHDPRRHDPRRRGRELNRAESEHRPVAAPAEASVRFFDHHRPHQRPRRAGRSLVPQRLTSRRRRRSRRHKP